MARGFSFLLFIFVLVGFFCTSTAVKRGDKLIVKCGTTKGDVKIELKPAWSPNGVTRFVELVSDGFFDGSALFRCVKNFLVQFGIAADPQKSGDWRKRGVIKDDPRRPDIGEGNSGPGGVFPRGGVSFAGSGENSRTTQLFITFADGVVGKMAWENQIGTVVEGLENVDSFYTGYGDMEMFNKGGVSPQKLEEQGIEYAKVNFPKLERFTKCEVESVSQEFVDMPKQMNAKFINKSGKDVHLFWVNVMENDAHLPQGVLKDGESVEQGTYSGHKFVLKENEGGGVLATASIQHGQNDYVYDGVKTDL